MKKVCLSDAISAMAELSRRLRDYQDATRNLIEGGIAVNSSLPAGVVDTLGWLIEHLSDAAHYSMLAAGRLCLWSTDLDDDEGQGTMRIERTEGRSDGVPPSDRSGA